MQQQHFDIRHYNPLSHTTPPSKQALGQHFDIRGIPALVLLDEDRKVISANAVGAVKSRGAGSFPWAPEPVKDLDEDADGVDEAPSLVVLMEKEAKGVQEEVGGSLLVLRPPGRGAVAGGTHGEGGEGSAGGGRKV